MTIAFEKSEDYRRRYPDLAFGLVQVNGCRGAEDPPGFAAFKKKHLRQMRRRETLAQIGERIDRYAEHFGGFGYPCPLTDHLRRTVNSGFPRYNLYIDAHFMAEMCAGILVAVADADRFRAPLLLDLAAEGEICQGMGGRTFHTRPGEIVLRDAEDIVCVLCQGADEKTRVGDETVNVLLYAYAVPGVTAEFLRQGLSVGAEALERFGGGAAGEIEVC